MFLLLDIGIAFLLDLIFGDPYWAPHPVRFIGWLIRKTEKLLRFIIKGKTSLLNGNAPHVNGNTPQGNGKTSQVVDKTVVDKKEFLAGTALTIIVVSITAFLVWIILYAASLISPVAFHVVNIYFMYTSLASKCLADEAKKVWRVLAQKDLVKARAQLAMLVGRQTDQLSEPEIIRGVVETTAENTVDGILSPLFYIFIGSFFGIGAPVVYAFKAASTLDSMVGYMNDKYMFFGRSSAKFDDLLNYLPARLSGIIIPIAAAFCGLDAKRSFRVMLRDRRNHKSPNCAYPEAAVAGALGVRLGGNNVYFGKIMEKPTIGDDIKALEACDITQTVKIMYVSAWITFILGFLAFLGILYF